MHRGSVWPNYLARIGTLGLTEGQEVDKSGWYKNIWSGSTALGNEVYLGKICKLLKMFLNNLELTAEEL